MKYRILFIIYKWHSILLFGLRIVKSIENNNNINTCFKCEYWCVCVKLFLLEFCLYSTVYRILYVLSCSRLFWMMSAHGRTKFISLFIIRYVQDCMKATMHIQNMYSANKFCLKVSCLFPCWNYLVKRRQCTRAQMKNDTQSF